MTVLHRFLLYFKALIIKRLLLFLENLRSWDHMKHTHLNNILLINFFSATVNCCRLLITFTNVLTMIRPDKMCSLIVIQIDCHSDGLPESDF